jgi:hypothetical protein
MIAAFRNPVMQHKLHLAAAIRMSRLANHYCTSETLKAEVAQVLKRLVLHGLIAVGDARVEIGRPGTHLTGQPVFGGIVKKLRLFARFKLDDDDPVGTEATLHRVGGPTANHKMSTVLRDRRSGNWNVLLVSLGVGDPDQ